MSDPAQTNASLPEARALRLLSLISPNFAVFSLLGLIVVVLCSTLFVYGYLSTFDLQLIWIIYPDILKFGLVALALISATFAFALQVAQSVTLIPLFKGKKRVIIIGAIVVGAIYGLWNFVASYPSQISLSLATSAGFLIASSGVIWTLVRAPAKANLAYIIVAFLMVMITMGACGGTLGTYIKYSKRGLVHDVFLKDRQMDNVRLVLFTTHHTVLYAGTDVVVLPTSEIIKIVAHPIAQQQRWP